MQLFTTEKIRLADEYTIKNEPIQSIDLMERAAHQCFNWIREKYLKDSSFMVICGPGNNGGDGLAISRMLLETQYNVKIVIPQFTNNFSDDFNINLDRLKSKYESTIHYIDNNLTLNQLYRDEIIIDALFGSGLSRPLKNFPAKIAEFINQTPTDIISIDIPSGVFAERNSEENLKTAIHAKHTLTFQFPKISFFLPETENYIGKVKVLPIGLHPDFINNTETSFFTLKKKDIRQLIHIRNKFSHKGTFGHGLLIAGSYGMFGASVLAAKAAKRSGIGLVSAHIPRAGYQILQTAVPEALISFDESDIIFTELPNIDKFSAIAAGPGLGTKTNTQNAVQKLLSLVNKPLVLDADALNIISMKKGLLDQIPSNTIITPHPKEFDRLFGESETHFDRIKKGISFAKKQKITIILKGANSCVISPSGKCYFNTTGNNGMGTGGSGDVLTGIVLSLLSQNYEAVAAAKIATYIHGLSGDIAAKKTGYHGLTASDIVENLGKAFKKFENE